MKHAKLTLFSSILSLFFCLLYVTNAQSQSKGKKGYGKEVTYAQILVDNIDYMLSYNLPLDSTIRLGYLNLKGEIVIPPDFQICTNFYGEYANVIKDSIYGYVDKKGKVTLFPGFEFLFWYYDDIGFAKKNDRYGLINREGKLITEIKYERISLPHQGYFPVKLEGRWNVLNDKGDLVFPQEIILDGQPVFDSKTIYIDTVVENGKKLAKRGIINVSGKIEIKAEYDQISGYVSEGLMHVKKNGKHGFINQKGEVIIPIEYEALRDQFSENLVGACKNKKWGYINRSNLLVIPYEYSMVEKFSDGISIVYRNGKAEFINKDNKRISGPVDFQIPWQGSFKEGLAVIKYNGKYGFVNKKGVIVIPAIYDNLLPFINGVSHITLNEMNGFIDKKGNEVIPPKFKQLWSGRGGLIRFVN